LLYESGNESEFSIYFSRRDGLERLLSQNNKDGDCGHLIQLALSVPPSKANAKNIYRALFPESRVVQYLDIALCWEIHHALQEYYRNREQMLNGSIQGRAF